MRMPTAQPATTVPSVHVHQISWESHFQGVTPNVLDTTNVLKIWPVSSSSVRTLVANQTQMFVAKVQTVKSRITNPFAHALEVLLEIRLSLAVSSPSRIFALQILVVPMLNASLEMTGLVPIGQFVFVQQASEETL